MTVILSALLVLQTASATVPWFDRATMELTVAENLPERYQQIAALKRTDPEAFEAELHSAMHSVLSGETNPALMEAIRRKWDLENLFEARRDDWHRASDLQRPAIRADLDSISVDLMNVKQEIAEMRLAISLERISTHEANLEYLLINRETMARERVEQALKP